MEENYYCFNHPSKYAKRYCKKCNQNICNTCALDEHSYHIEEIESLNLFYVSTSNSKDIVSLVNNTKNKTLLSNELAKNLQEKSMLKHFCMYFIYHEATHYCKVCSNFICKECLKYHTEKFGDHEVFIFEDYYKKLYFKAEILNKVLLFQNPEYNYKSSKHLAFNSSIFSTISKFDESLVKPLYILKGNLEENMKLCKNLHENLYQKIFEYYRKNQKRLLYNQKNLILFLKEFEKANYEPNKIISENKILSHELLINDLVGEEEFKSYLSIYLEKEKIEALVDNSFSFIESISNEFINSIQKSIIDFNSKVASSSTKIKEYLKSKLNFSTMEIDDLVKQCKRESNYFNRNELNIKNKILAEEIGKKYENMYNINPITYINQLNNQVNSNVNANLRGSIGNSNGIINANLNPNFNSYNSNHYKHQSNNFIKPLTNFNNQFSLPYNTNIPPHSQNVTSSNNINCNNSFNNNKVGNTQNNSFLQQSVTNTNNLNTGYNNLIRMDPRFNRVEKEIALSENVFTVASKKTSVKSQLTDNYFYDLNFLDNKKKYSYNNNPLGKETMKFIREENEHFIEREEVNLSEYADNKTDVNNYENRLIIEDFHEKEMNNINNISNYINLNYSYSNNAHEPGNIEEENEKEIAIDLIVEEKSHDESKEESRGMNTTNNTGNFKPFMRHEENYLKKHLFTTNSNNSQHQSFQESKKFNSRSNSLKKCKKRKIPSLSNKAINYDSSEHLYIQNDKECKSASIKSNKITNLLRKKKQKIKSNKSLVTDDWTNNNAKSIKSRSISISLKEDQPKTNFYKNKNDGKCSDTFSEKYSTKLSILNAKIKLAYRKNSDIKSFLGIKSNYDKSEISKSKTLNSLKSVNEMEFVETIDENNQNLNIPEKSHSHRTFQKKSNKIFVTHSDKSRSNNFNKEFIANSNQNQIPCFSISNKLNLNISNNNTSTNFLSIEKLANIQPPKTNKFHSSSVKNNCFNFNSTNSNLYNQNQTLKSQFNIPQIFSNKAINLSSSYNKSGGQKLYSNIQLNNLDSIRRKTQKSLITTFTNKTLDPSSLSTNLKKNDSVKKEILIEDFDKKTKLFSYVKDKDKKKRSQQKRIYFNFENQLVYFNSYYHGENNDSCKNKSPYNSKKPDNKEDLKDNATLISSLGSKKSEKYINRFSLKDFKNNRLSEEILCGNNGDIKSFKSDSQYENLDQLEIEENKEINNVLYRSKGFDIRKNSFYFDRFILTVYNRKLIMYENDFCKPQFFELSEEELFSYKDYAFCQMWIKDSNKNIKKVLVVTGGKFNNKNISKKCLYLEVVSNYALKIDLPQTQKGHYQHTLISYCENYLFSLGGIENYNEMFSFKDKTWFKIPSFSSTKIKPNAIIVNKQLYCFSDFSIERLKLDALDNNFIGDLKWENLNFNNPNKLQISTSSGLISFSDKFYLIGGKNSSDEENNNIICFDLKDMKMTLEKTMSRNISFLETNLYQENERKFVGFDNNGNIFSFSF